MTILSGFFLFFSFLSLSFTESLGIIIVTLRWPLVSGQQKMHCFRPSPEKHVPCKGFYADGGHPNMAKDPFSASLLFLSSPDPPSPVNKWLRIYSQSEMERARLQMWPLPTQRCLSSRDFWHFGNKAQASHNY